MERISCDPLQLGGERHALRHVQFNPAIRIDVVVDQRREAAPIVHRHAIAPGRFRQDFLDEQGIDVD